MREGTEDKNQLPLLSFLPPILAAKALTYY